MIIPSDNFFKKFKETYGAFSCCEAIALFNIVLEAPCGDFLELGSHKCKSSQVIAAAMPSASNLILVEPEFKNHEWLVDAMSKVSYLLPENGLEWVADYSLNVIPNYDSLAFCFIDSGVHDDMVMDEVKLLEHKIISGGIIAFHDYKNQFTAVERAYNYLWATGKFEPITIDWKQIFDYARENKLEEGNNSWHESGSEEFPKFVGALRRK